MNIRLTPILLLLASLMATAAFAQGHGSPSTSGWRMVSNEDQIEVYTRRGSGNIKEVRIKLRIQASMEVLNAYTSQVPLYANWVYKTSEARLIRRSSPSEFWYYIRTDFPFPASDRDLVVHSHSRIDPTTGIMHAHSVAAPNELPQVADCVRITLFETTWKITPVGATAVDIDYWARTDPGGSIPAWIINLGITMGPTRTMQALRREVERRMASR